MEGCAIDVDASACCGGKCGFVLRAVMCVWIICAERECQIGASCGGEGLLWFGRRVRWGQLRVVLALAGARAVCTQRKYMLRAWPCDLLYCDCLVCQMRPFNRLENSDVRCAMYDVSFSGEQLRPPCGRRRKTHRTSHIAHRRFEPD